MAFHRSTRSAGSTRRPAAERSAPVHVGHHGVPFHGPRAAREGARVGRRPAPLLVGVRLPYDRACSRGRVGNSFPWRGESVRPVVRREQTAQVPSAIFTPGRIPRGVRHPSPAPSSLPSAAGPTAETRRTEGCTLGAVRTLPRIEPRAALGSGLEECVPGRCVHMVRDLVVAIAHAQRPGGFEHEDRGAGRSVRLVLRASRDGEDRSLGEQDRALPTGVLRFRRTYAADRSSRVAAPRSAGVQNSGSAIRRS